MGDAEKNEKFRKLMGIKAVGGTEVTIVHCTLLHSTSLHYTLIQVSQHSAASVSKVLSKEEQDRLHAEQEQSYEVGRQQTHKNK